MKIVISSGHGKLIRGASGYIDEVDEARRVVHMVASYLNDINVGVEVFHDDVSTTQDQNLNRIVDFHNSKQRDLDVSVHFNAYETTSSPMGTECLYLTQDALAQQVATKVHDASGLINRGPKKRDDLFFLNNTERSAILIEVCFVDSQADVELYKENFEEICAAISGSISGVSQPSLPEQPGNFEPLPSHELKELLTIGPVTIYASIDGKYVKFVSDLSICNDGYGPSHGDPSYQSMTAYYSGGVEGNKYLSAEKDFYVVIPPQIRSMVPPVVMGCMAKLTNTKTGVFHAAVTGEIGPDYETGEAAYCLAKIINPSIDYNSGDTNRIYRYELWPGQAAVVNGFQYKLQPA